MVFKLGDVDDVIMIICEKLFGKIFKDNISRTSNVKVSPIDYVSFYSFIQVFDRHSQIVSKNPLFGQMMEIYNIKNKDLDNLTPTIFYTDSDLILKYVVENNKANFTIWEQSIGRYIRYKCVKYLYENMNSRNMIVSYLRNYYSKWFYDPEMIQRIGDDSYTRICKLIIRENISKSSEVIFIMIRAKLDIRVIDYLNAKYHIPYVDQWPRPFVGDISRPTESYFEAVIDVFMKYYDQFTVFKDIVIYTMNYRIIKKVIDKYDIANTLAKKLSIDQINDLNMSVKLMICGVCEYDEEEFWKKFRKSKEYQICLISDEELQFLYDNSTCSFCLQNNLIHVCDFDNGVIRAMLLFMNKLPLKLCSECRSLYG
jgi:hypothetical protein